MWSGCEIVLTEIMVPKTARAQWTIKYIVEKQGIFLIIAPLLPGLGNAAILGQSVEI